jgi:chorismate-pyruvate lyase
MTDLATLIALFYPQASELGSFEQTPADAVPEPYRSLLAHEHHMTVTVEAFHDSLVDVRVLQRLKTDTHYAREILLARQTDGHVVQYGIMRINLAYLSEPVRARILAEDTPLGRILIEHDVHRRINLHHLWKISPGPALSKAMELPAASADDVVYGRTAMIYCDNEPAIELLEIVSPVEPE